MKRGRQGEGGGRPTKPTGERKQSISITLPPDYIVWLKKDGNASETVRKLIEKAVESLYNNEKDSG